MAVLPLTALSFHSEAGNEELGVSEKAKLVFPNMVLQGYAVGLPAPRLMASWLERFHLAVRKMHAAGVFHLDLHPNNAMFRIASSGDEVEDLVLIDFDSALSLEEDVVCQAVVDHIRKGRWDKAYPETLVADQPPPKEADWYFVAGILLGHLRGLTEDWVKGPDRAITLAGLKAVLEKERSLLETRVSALETSLVDGVEKLKALELVDGGVTL